MEEVTLEVTLSTIHDERHREVDNESGLDGIGEQAAHKVYEAKSHRCRWSTVGIPLPIPTLSP
jgi:hypothetical protein